MNVPVAVPEAITPSENITYNLQVVKNVNPIIKVFGSKCFWGSNYTIPSFSLENARLHQPFFKSNIFRLHAKYHVSSVWIRSWTVLCNRASERKIMIMKSCWVRPKISSFFDVYNSASVTRDSVHGKIGPPLSLLVNGRFGVWFFSKWLLS